MTTLDVQENYLSGSLKGLPPNILVFEAQANSLTGTIPQLPSTLQALTLARNRISGTIPFTLPSLLTLSLEFNELTGTLGFLKTMPQLQFGTLSNNRFTGQMPPWYSMSQDLDVLTFANNLLTG